MKTRYCTYCSRCKQEKFFENKEHHYCKSCENKKPDLKKYRYVKTNQGTLVLDIKKL